MARQGGIIGKDCSATTGRNHFVTVKAECSNPTECACMTAVIVASQRLGRVFDLYLAHLAVVYLLGVSCLARRFGPAWIEAPVLTGSVAAFLVGLGALHHRLGHHRRAAELLVSRARELAEAYGDRFLPPASLIERAERNVSF